MFEELLDIPEGAGQFEALEALSSLREDVAAAKACCAQKEEELQHLREQTAELVAAQLAEAGADEDYVQAAKAIWLQAPHSVSQAIGLEVLKGANPYGCNQYGHKKGHDGGSDSEESSSKQSEITREVAEFKKMAEAAYSTLEEKRKKISKSNDSQIGKGIRLDEVQRNASYVKMGLQELERAKARYEEAINIMSDPNYDPEFIPETSVWYDGDKELEKRRKHYEIKKRDLSKAIDEYQKL